MIRDFIYVDGERLNSLYSQVFGGIPRGVVRSIGDTRGVRSRTSSAASSADFVDDEGGESSQTTESRDLLDHLYNELDSKLGASILDGSTLAPETLVSVLSDVMLVRATGPAEIHDYHDLDMLFKRYNEIGIAIATMTMTASGVFEQARQMSESLASIKDRNERAKIQAIVKTAADIKAEAKKKNMQLDERFLNALDVLLSFSSPGAFELLVSPGAVNSPIGFRGILNRDWLRYSSTMMRALFRGRSFGSWTMVGHVTSVGGHSSVEGTTTGSDSIRDAFRLMFEAFRGLDDTFLTGKVQQEVVVSPLAVYREFPSPTA